MELGLEALLLWCVFNKDIETVEDHEKFLDGLSKWLIPDFKYSLEEIDEHNCTLHVSFREYGEHKIPVTLGDGISVVPVMLHVGSSYMREVMLSFSSVGNLVITRDHMREGIELPDNGIESILRTVVMCTEFMSTETGQLIARDKVDLYFLYRTLYGFGVENSALISQYIDTPKQMRKSRYKLILNGQILEGDTYNITLRVVPVDEDKIEAYLDINGKDLSESILITKEIENPFGFIRARLKPVEYYFDKKLTYRAKK